MCAGAFSPLVIERGEEDLIIAVDAGFGHLERMGILPDYLIGDLDSIEPPLLPALREFSAARPERVIRLPVEKDDTDTIYALRFGLKLGYRRFDLYGAMGGRLDHTLANLQSLLFVRRHGADAYLFDERCMVFVIEEETRRFVRGMTGMFSLFALSERCGDVTITGMKYPLEHGVLSSSFPLGVSNEFDPGADDGQGHGASVTVRQGAALAVVTYRVEKKTGEAVMPPEFH